MVAAQRQHPCTTHSRRPFTKHQDLVKRYEGKDQKCDELRSKLTATKSALSARERELETAQRMLQKSAAEKGTLKVTCSRRGWVVCVCFWEWQQHNPHLSPDARMAAA